jgi:hypothetical protein
MAKNPLYFCNNPLSLKNQTAFPGTFGKSLNPTVIYIAATIKNNLFDTS